MFLVVDENRPITTSSCQIEWRVMDVKSRRQAVGTGRVGHVMVGVFKGMYILGAWA